MSHVSPVFTEYEQQVLREIAVHKIRPHLVQRALDTLGRPFSKLLDAGRDSNNRALRGVTDRIHGWVEEGLIGEMEDPFEAVKWQQVLGGEGFLRKLKDQWNQRVERPKNYGQKKN